MSNTVLNLNSQWAFAKDVSAVPSLIPAEAEFINIPHSWNAIDGMDGGADYSPSISHEVVGPDAMIFVF